MALIESLDIVLALSTNKMAAGTKVAKGLLNDLNSAARSTKAMVAGLAGAVGIGLGVAGLKSLVSASFEAVDQLGDVSDRLQISTEQLGGFQYAAKLGGVEADTFEASLDRMVRTLGAIDSVSDPAAKSLAKMGLDINQLRQLDTAEQFLQIADAINNVGSVAGRAAAATEIFGKRGTSLLVTFAGGRKGIEELAARFDALGGSFSRIDSAKVQMAADAMDDLKIAISGVGNEIAIGLAPLLEVANNEIIEFNKAAGDAGVDGANGMNLMFEATVMVADVVDTIGIGFQFAQAHVLNFVAETLAGMEEVGQEVTNFFNRLAGLAEGPSTESEFVKSLREQAKAAMDEANEEFLKPTAGEKLRVAEAQLMFDAEQKAKDAVENAKRENELTAALEDQEKAAKGVADSFKNAMDAARELHERGMKIFEQNRTPLEKFADDINNINFLLLQGAIDAETFGREAKRLQDELSNASQTKVASAVTRDSDAATRIIAQNQNRGRNIGADIGKSLLQQLKELKEQNRTLKNIDKNLEIGNAADLVFNIA